MDSASFASGGSETPQPRRVMTAPVLASTSPQQSTSPASQAATATAQSKASPEDLVETLYSHPSARIISFTSSRHDFATSFSGHDAPPGSLPPSSRLERTIAVGRCQQSIVDRHLPRYLHPFQIPNQKSISSSNTILKVSSESTVRRVLSPSSAVGLLYNPSFPKVNAGVSMRTIVVSYCKYAGPNTGESRFPSPILMTSAVPCNSEMSLTGFFSSKRPSAPSREASRSSSPTRHP